MSYSRRDFGKLALAAVPFAEAYGAIHSKFKGVQIGAISYSFRSMQPDEIIPSMVKVGLGEVELMSNDCEALAGAPLPPRGGRGRAAADAPAVAGGRRGGRGQMTPDQQEAQRVQQENLKKWRMSASPATFKSVKKLFNDAGIDVHILCFNQRLNATDDEIEYAFQMAKALDVKAISSSSTVAFAKRVAPFADKHKMLWAGHGHDNVADPEEFSTPKSFETIMSYSKYIAINLDIGHFTAAGFDPIPYIKEVHAHITNLHLKDRTKPAAGGGRPGNLPWGQGDTPIKEVLQLMSKEKYGFPANIELEYQVPAGSDVPTEMSKCLQYCKSALT
jgi:sugar phosphate isomerase/epimerase